MSSTERSMTLSWKQSGSVDEYIIKQNSTQTSDVSFTGVGTDSVSVTVNNLPTSGALYCISVTAVSGHLHSDEVELCNYTGEQLAVVMLHQRRVSFFCALCTNSLTYILTCMDLLLVCIMDIAYFNNS